METIQVNVDPQQVNKYMAEKILQSTIGAAVEHQIKEHVKKLENTWDSPIKNVLTAETDKLVREVILTTYKEKITAMVKKAITDEVLTKLVNEMVHNLHIEKSRY